MALYTGQETIFDYIAKGLADGQHQLRIGSGGVTNDVTFNVYNFTNNVTYTAAPSYVGDNSGEFGDILIYHGNLTINSGVTMTSFATKAGIYIWVAGTLTNNGFISMTARGIYNTWSYSNYHLYKNGTTYATLPTSGGAGGVGQTLSAGNNTDNWGGSGYNGATAPSRGTGGGGAGSVYVRGVNNGTGTATAGSGGAGRQFGGGGGGGGIDISDNTSRSANSANGSAGGSAFARRANSTFATRGAGGGAGAGSGGGRFTQSGELTGSAFSSYDGQVGVGGVLVIYANNIANNNIFSSVGYNGGTGLRAGGGGSGGGSISIFYRTGTPGSASVGGGSAGSVTTAGVSAGSGGAGSFVTTIVPSTHYLSTSIGSSGTALGSSLSIPYTINSAFNSTNYSVYLLQGAVKTFIVNNATTTSRTLTQNASVTRDLITNKNNYSFVVEATSNGITTSSTATITITDTLPSIQTEVINNNNISFTVNTTIADSENDFVKYRVLLNGTKIHPTSTDFTSFAQSPITYTTTLLSSQVNMDTNNTLTIDAYDVFNTNITNTNTFFAGYRGLMFSDASGNYYTTDLGQLLSHFDLGYINYGVFSNFSFYVKNTLGSSKNNVTIRTNSTLDSNVTVEFSLDQSSYSTQLNIGTLTDLQSKQVFMRIKPNSPNINDREFEVIVGSD